MLETINTVDLLVLYSFFFLYISISRFQEPFTLFTCVYDLSTNQKKKKWSRDISTNFQKFTLYFFYPKLRVLLFFLLFIKKRKNNKLKTLMYWSLKAHRAAVELIASSSRPSMAVLSCSE